MPDITTVEPTQKKPHNPLHGVVSDKAVVAVGKAISGLTDKFMSTGIKEAEYTKVTHKVAEILVADFDGRDGKFDHKIDKALILEKMKNNEAMKNLGFKGEMRILDQFPTQKIDGREYIDSKLLLAALKVKADTSFDNLDKNHDHVLSHKDFESKSKATLTDKDLHKFSIGHPTGESASLSPLISPIPKPMGRAR